VLVIQVENMPAKQPQETTVLFVPSFGTMVHTFDALKFSCFRLRHLIEEGSKRDVQCPRDFLQRIDRGYGVAVFCSRNVRNLIPRSAEARIPLSARGNDVTERIVLSETRVYYNERSLFLF
jgi:hypothetical protein